jgi:hypothetical protein
MSTTEYSERSGPRIRAYLASMRPLRGCSGLADKDEYQRGRSLIEKLAIWHDCIDAGELPELAMTIADASNIVEFIRNSEPVEGDGWWNDSNTPGPSHLCGFHEVLRALNESLDYRAEPAFKA